MGTPEIKATRSAAEHLMRTPRVAIRRVALSVVGLLIALVLIAAAWVYRQLSASVPVLEGRITAAELTSPVIVARDAQGVPTITGRYRIDLAWALGFLHGQERFFQMDGQRRTAAGELSDLAGPVALDLDRRHRVHRFRSRARDAVAALEPDERKILEAYASGVNRGLAALDGVPFEYLVLRAKPEPWTVEDTVLTAYAMYLTLQEPAGATERWRQNASQTIGPALTDFLFPQGSSWDAPLDGSVLPAPEIPATRVKKAARSSLDATGEPVEPPMPGSNGFAVGGQLTGHGRAMLANDLHLGLRVPNIWYRARLIVQSGAGDPELDITGISLAGAPTVVAGSNGHLAWGFTNSYVDTSDVVILEPVDGSPSSYRAPEGPKELRSIEETLCRKCPQPQVVTVEESVWGPVIGTDPQGRKLAYRWIAHDPIGAGLGGSLELERAESAKDALAIAHRLRIPHQNLVAADARGNIGWTVTSALPRRFGHDGQQPASWGDGTVGWNGYLDPDEIPVIFNPEGQRIWTANARVVGGEPLRKLGFGGYANGSRAGQIRDGLFARKKFTERDLLAIQLDDRGALLDRWHVLLIEALNARPHRRELAPLVPEVENWGGRRCPTLSAIGWYGPSDLSS
jgi:penicillin G amidase